ncbi:hypothetical protein M0805_005420 [Coniferiporia weirii]|nr:hypothetical protein M0805_005420 [Coniferiporia weirii]
MSAFELFKSAFKGDLVLPSDTDYEKAVSRWANNAARRARIVAFVKDAEDASLAIKFARSEKLPIAVRGGGQCFRVDSAKKLGYVGGGALWETVDKAAIEHGLATVGGTVNHTGVGGLTLGGGYGWLTARHGLAIDNLRQVTMVVADGSIITANDNENVNLFWAVRGGGCNFGVCTEFVLQLHDQRRTVYAGSLIYPGSLIDSVVETTREWWENGPSDKEGLLMIMTRGPPPECQPCVVCVPFFNGSEAEGREAYKAFLDLKPHDLSAEIPYEKLNSLQNEATRHGRNVYMRGVLQSSIRPETATEVLDKVAEVTADSTFQVAAIFEYFPLDKVNAVPKNAMAFDNRTTSQNVLVNCIWDEHTPENSKTGRDKVYAVSDLITSFEKDLEVSEARAYGNYASDSTSVSPDRVAKLFGDNYPTLQVLKKKYDPDVIFNKWFPVTPV